MKRVAIYSRKSKFTGIGDSIENQIEICKNYIQTTSIDKDLEFIIYEDEGYTGDTTNRPKFIKLINDIKNKKINTLACYKLDRVSRNVSDFSSTLEILNENNCAFISVTEQFDTSTPMGRAMMYIASVFAQLERETIAERVKDNMLEMAKNGKWTGGRHPLGFKSKKITYEDESGDKRSYTKLIKDDEESKIVKLLFEKYLELGSLHQLEKYIFENNIKSRNGFNLEKSTLKIILQNTVYVKADSNVINFLNDTNWTVYGEPDGIHSLLTYNKTEQSKKNGKSVKQKKDISERIAAISSIEGFIEPQLWLEVQNQFIKNKDTFPRLGKTHNALLTGIIKCGCCGSWMQVSHGQKNKDGIKNFYYRCSNKVRSKECSNKNAKVLDADETVLHALKKLSLNNEGFIEKLKAINNNKNKTSKTSISEKNKLLSQKNKQINNLVEKLSLDDSLTEILMEKIKALKNECDKLNKEISQLSSYNYTSKQELININQIRSLLNSCENIESLPREEIKIIINTLIDKVYWYGPTEDSEAKIKIVFIFSDDDNPDPNNPGPDKPKKNGPFQLLQFRSHSMTSINSIATFFKDTTHKVHNYYNLPEATLGDKLIKYRKINNISRRELALKIGISYTSICRYEQNKISPEKNLEKINLFFNKT